MKVGKYLRLVLNQLICRLNEVCLNLFICQVRRLTLSLFRELVVALPDGFAIGVVGVLNFRPVPATAIPALELAREDAHTAEAVFASRS